MTDTEPAAPPADPAVADPITDHDAATLASIIDREVVALADLKPHPRNYRHHPADQIEHLAASIKQHGFYKNIVVARDLTILAGHGAVQAATVAGMTEIPVARLDLDPDSPAALKIVTGDNELGRFAEIDDRILTEILREVAEEDPLGLLGTGYDEQILANLLMVTRHASEIRDIDEAAEWVGLPDYEPAPAEFKVIITFGSNADRRRFLDEKDLWACQSAGSWKEGSVFSGFWPVPDDMRNDRGLEYRQAGLADPPDPEAPPEAEVDEPVEQVAS